LPYDPHRYRAEAPGDLPAAGVTTVADIEVPPGTTITSRWSPLCWITDDEIDEPADLYSEFRRAFHITGLWPVLVGDVEWLQTLRPDQKATPPDSVNLHAVLGERYRDNVSYYFEEYPIVRRSFGPTLDELAPPSTSDSDPAAADNVADNQGRYSRLCLVPTTRPADVPLVLGWNQVETDDAGILTAILRSLEDRFEAVPVCMDSRDVLLAVQRPPAVGAEARALAAELIALSACSMEDYDNLDLDFIRGTSYSQSINLWWNQDR